MIKNGYGEVDENGVIGGTREIQGSRHRHEMEHLLDQVNLVTAPCRISKAFTIRHPLFGL